MCAGLYIIQNYETYIKATFSNYFVNIFYSCVILYIFIEFIHK